MALKRIQKELSDFEQQQNESGATFLPYNNSSLHECEYRFNTDACGGDVSFMVKFPSDYPFKPPKISIDEVRCSCPNAVQNRFKMVCPQFVCWGRSWDLRFDLLAEQWSPALTSCHILETVRERMCGPSFPEAVEFITESVPAVQEGTLMIAFCTAGEAPLQPSGTPELFLLIDPQWSSMGLVQWSVVQAHYVALSAPYCFNDPTSIQGLRFLLDGLRAKGWTNIAFTQSAGMMIELPRDLPAISTATGIGSWEMVPECLNRWGSGETPANYGGW